MQVTRKYSKLEEATFTIDRADLVGLLQTAAQIPGGFEVSHSSIDGDWPLVVTVARKSPETVNSSPAESVK